MNREEYVMCKTNIFAKEDRLL